MGFEAEILIITPRLSIKQLYIPEYVKSIELIHEGPNGVPLWWES
jgi:hypothetical protein